MNLDQTLRQFLFTLPIGRRLRVLLAWRDTSALRVGARLMIRPEKISKFINGEHYLLKGEPIREICKLIEAPEEIFKEVLE